ncbi:zinc finger protein-like 1 homolog [Colias croceus]|uniref:zinc finger protein-like 1 homolog n=1 Tax=Colias crocea TaxID=72248 RepID=UPI001E27BFC3|nr:zinc finger protein-like 1 homolog [Colias croceus]
MGLCKCPKRRVTNQFCFEHRVNVCEYCMVTNHPKCIIQSYLQWLQDSDYNPICEICTKSLADGECIRLTCYHVFHWECAESRYRALPRTTAPAGYQCPSCATPVFPPPNLVSPVADVLKEKLAGVNWARAGLGLPLLSEEQDLKGASSRRSQSPMEQSHYFTNSTVDSQREAPVGASDDEAVNRSATSSPHSIVQITDDPVNIYDSTSMKRNDNLQGAQMPRKGYKSDEHSKPLFDHDENKYKQKSTLAWLSRWWKNTLPSSRIRRTGPMYRRYWLIFFIVLILLIVIVILSDRGIDDDNPFGGLRGDDRRVLQKN